MFIIVRIIMLKIYILYITLNICPKYKFFLTRFDHALKRLLHRNFSFPANARKSALIAVSKRYLWYFNR